MNGYIIAGIVIMLLALCNWQRRELQKFEITRYTLPMWQDNKEITRQTKLRRVCRFVFVSDLHNHAYGKNNERLLTAIDEAAPDFIVTAGDMLVARPGERMDTAIQFVEELAGRYPVYYGNGNHEYRLRIYPEKYGDMYERYRAAMDAAGVHYLENKSEVVAFGNRRINICGLEIDRHYYKRLEKVTMEPDYVTSEVGKKPDIYTILLAHNPEYFQQYAQWGAELTLSGHLHGGVMRLPKLGGVISPQLHFFPAYSGGLYKQGSKRMLVSRGLGTHTIPFRIFNRAQLIVVDLADEE